LLIDNNATYYSNRAQAYINLNANEEALKDAEEAIKLDSNFTRAYGRKATAQYNLKQYIPAK
jgi:tetratricopeptide (TPR) repeat protein